MISTGTSVLFTSFVVRFTGLKVHFPGFVRQALIHAGANLETSSLSGCSPLMFAASNGHLAVVEVRCCTEDSQFNVDINRNSRSVNVRSGKFHWFESAFCWICVAGTR